MKFLTFAKCRTQVCLVYVGVSMSERSLVQTTNIKENKSDTRLPQWRVGGQGPYLRSLVDLGRSSEVKDRQKNKTNKSKE